MCPALLHAFKFECCSILTYANHWIILVNRPINPPQSQFYLIFEGNSVLTKVDPVGKLNVFHKYNILLPLRMEGYWDVHNELERIQKQGETNIGKFLLHDQELIRIGGIATGAAAGVGAIAEYLGLGALVNILSGGGTPAAPIGVNAIHMNLSYLRNNR